MALPALVLVHGGGLAADSWHLTVNEIQRLCPELTVLAVDLPGRRGKPRDLGTLTIADWVDSVVRDIDAAEMNDVVIVGHSMAGLTVPGVVTRLGASRVREMILATAFVPQEGTSMADTLPWPGGPTARRHAKKGTPGETSAMMARFVLLNGVPRARRRFMTGRRYAESSRIMAENVSRCDMPDEVPRTWILTTRDRPLSVKSQHRSIEAIGGVQTLIEIDTCHCLMVSEPERLAEILVGRCQAVRVVPNP
jgi:pimeloyl-ACP methyl ester carboxylesterase